MDCSKENKKRFFRKGQSQPSSGPHSQSGVPIQGQIISGQNPPKGHIGAPRSHPSAHQSSQHRSFDMAPAPYSSGRVQHPPQLQTLELDAKQLQTLQNLQNLQNLQALQNLQNLQISSRLAQQQQLQKQKVSGSQGGKGGRVSVGSSHSGASISLDEAEINMNAHRRYMPAPRRARSAERFDGMRVQIPQQIQQQGQHQHQGCGSGKFDFVRKFCTKILLQNFCWSRFASFILWNFEALLSFMVIIFGLLPLWLLFPCEIQEFTLLSMQSFLVIDLHNTIGKDDDGY